MQQITEIILTLQKEEIRFFKLWANRYGYDKERKDFQLFEFIRQHKETWDEEEISHILYPNGDKNAYYRLKNRLIQDLHQSYWIQHYEKDSFTFIFYLYSLARLHYQAKRQGTAISLLKKAEKEATKEENFALLDLIYREFIQISIETAAYPPESYIRLRKKNRKMLEALHELEDTLAMVVHRIHASLNTNAEKTFLDELETQVESVIRTFQSGVQKKWRLRIYEALIRILLQKNDYPTMEQYLLNTYHIFQQERLFTKDNHETKLNMLTYLVNTLNRNEKFELSLQYAEKLKHAMKEFQGFLYDKYEFFYYNALFVNYFELDKNRATEILLKMKALSEEKPFASFSVLSININLALMYFKSSQHRKVIRALQETYITTEYKLSDISLRLKVQVFELVSRYEMGDYERMVERASDLKKEFSDSLALPSFKMDAHFIRFLCDTFPHTNQPSILQSLTQQFLEEFEETPDTHSFFIYKDWLKRKFMD